jgi:hypothetical protein
MWDFLRHVLFNENTMAAVILNGLVNFWFARRNKKDIDGVAEAIPTERARARCEREGRPLSTGIDDLD